MRLFVLISIFSLTIALKGQSIFNKSGLLHLKTLSQKDSVQNLKAHLHRDTAASDSAKRIPKSILVPKIKGSNYIETYYTTYQNPRVYSEPQYARLGGNTSIRWLGLPLNLNYYYTTETQSLYNSNYFRIQFDKPSVIKGLTNTWQEKYNSTLTSLNNARIDAGQNKRVEDALQTQKERLESEMAQKQSQLESKEDAFRSDLDHEKDSVYQKFKTDTSGISDTLRNRFLDSVKYHYYKQRQKDSASIERIKQDTQRIGNQIRNIQKKYKEAQDKKNTIDSTYKADSAKLFLYKQMLSNPEEFAGAWLKEKGHSKSAQVLSKVQDFQIGLVSPAIHKYSLYGIGQKGLYSEFRLGKNILGIDIGKTQAPDLSLYNRNRVSYDRFVIAGYISRSIKLNSQITVFAHHLKDPETKFSKEKRTAYSNSNLGFALNSNPIKSLKLEANFAYSSFQTLNVFIQNANYTEGQRINSAYVKSRSAYHIIISKSLGKSFVSEASEQYVGPGFKNLGNPFMRTNFFERQIKIKGGIIHNQLLISAYYKTLHDNSLGLSETTNTTSGYGVSIRSRFKNKKLPNFNFSISPYEQGNNNPDTLFRVNNKFSIINAGINYRIFRPRLKYSLLFNYTQSTMKSMNNGLILVQNYSLNQDFIIGKYFQAGLLLMAMRSLPSIDSNQLNGGQIRLGYTTKKNVAIQLNGLYSQYLSGAYRKGFSAMASIPVNKRIKLNLRAGYDMYYKMWGRTDKIPSFFGLVRMECLVW